MKKKFADESQKMDRELIQYKNMANTTNEELALEKNKSNSLQKEVEKLSSKLNEYNRYISELPTKDELKENETKFTELKSENESLKQKVADFDKRHAKAKQFIRTKYSELSECKETIEKLELEKEKISLEFQNYKIETQTVGDLIERCKENANLKAELEISHKFIASLQEKLGSVELKFKDQISELNSELEEKEKNFSILKQEVDLKEENLVETNKKIKELNWQKKNLEQENSILNEKINSLETALSSETLKLIKILFKELNLTIKDLDVLVASCIDIYHGNQIDICSLLGTAKQCSGKQGLEKREFIIFNHYFFLS